MTYGKKKISKQIEWRFSILYGIGPVLISVALVAFILYDLFKIFFLGGEFSWGQMALTILIAGVSGLIGYALIRVGLEELED